MKVLHVITDLNRGGGAESVLYNLVRTNTENTHVVVSLKSVNEIGELLEKHDVDVFELKLLSVFGIPAAFFRFRKIINIESPNVVQTWMYHSDIIGGLFSRLAGVTNIVWGLHHSHLSKEGSSKSSIVISKICARMSGYLPSKIISCSKIAAIVHTELGYKGDKIEVVHNGYDVNDFVPNVNSRLAIREELGLDQDIFLVGMLARFDHQKDHENLFKSFSMFSKLKAPEGTQIKLLLAGRGITRENDELTALIDKYCLAEYISLLGVRSDVNAVMNSLDIHVLSSVTGEAFPNVLNEAMSCGVPCVTTDVGDSSLIVGDTGWVVPIADPQAFANAIRGAYEEFSLDSVGWGKRGILSRQRIVDNFSIEKCVEGYNKVWRSIL